MMGCNSLNMRPPSSCGVPTAFEEGTTLQFGSLFDPCGVTGLSSPMDVSIWSVLILDVCIFVHVLLRKYCLTMKEKGGRIEAGYLVLRVHHFQARGNSQLLHIETMDACAEAAARRMSVFLVQRYNILVVDLNLEQRVRNEQCAQLYCCKYDSLHRIQKELPAASRYEIVPVEGLDYGTTRVELDFMALMKEVVDLFRIAVTPITVLRTIMIGCFIALFGISVPGSVSPSHGVVGFKASSISVAKQILAKEALMLMSMWYRFEVEDVSYFLLANSSQLKTHQVRRPLTIQVLIQLMIRLISRQVIQLMIQKMIQLMMLS